MKKVLLRVYFPSVTYIHFSKGYFLSDVLYHWTGIGGYGVINRSKFKIGRIRKYL